MVDKPTRSGRMLAASVSVVLLAAACASGSAAETVDIASLGGASSDGEEPAVASSESAEQVALDFARCMRDNGVDFPDPTVDDDGTPGFLGAFGDGRDRAFDPRSEEFENAVQACSELTGGLAIGGGRRGGRFDPAEIQDSLLPFTACLRDQGLDVGDLAFGAPGAGAPEAGGPGAGGQGGPGNFGQRGQGGDPSVRIAGLLGFDSDDPAWIAANEVCQPVFDEAFAGLNPGNPGVAG